MFIVPSISFLCLLASLSLQCSFFIEKLLCARLVGQLDGLKLALVCCILNTHERGQKNHQKTFPPINLYFLACLLFVISLICYWSMELPVFFDWFLNKLAGSTSKFALNNFHQAKTREKYTLEKIPSLLCGPPKIVFWI